MPTARGYAAPSPTSPLAPWSFPRRAVGERDVRIDIKFAGICHSDLHFTRGEWGNEAYPALPGHEIVGTVTAVGRKVKGFKLGDTAGVGCMVNSCRTCANCKKGLEQHCLGGAVFTYGSVDRDGTRTYGGYSDHIVVDQDFVLKVGKNQPLERVAPLLCAGITTYSPLKRAGLRKGSKVGVMGLGGLGHMAVKLAAAFGAEVTMISTSPSKMIDAKRLGAHDFLLSSDEPAVTKSLGRFDFIIDTISADHDLGRALGLLKTGGELCLVGAPPKPLPVASFALIGGRKRLSGSLIGGVAETQEMLDFCAKRKVLADVEVVAFKDVNTAWERMLKGDVRYRFSLDSSTL
jgi:uncharacterized zinc-type alcohol dehydrogenase-like protein